jgi:hypothetical protein
LTAGRAFHPLAGLVGQGGQSLSTGTLDADPLGISRSVRVRCHWTVPKLLLFVEKMVEIPSR